MEQTRPSANPPAPGPPCSAPARLSGDTPPQAGAEPGHAGLSRTLQPIPSEATFFENYERLWIKRVLYLIGDFFTGCRRLWSGAHQDDLGRARTPRARESGVREQGWELLTLAEVITALEVVT